jgi:superfamily I DNA/RNA helicase
MNASKYQIDIYNEFRNTDNNINISAVAGSGKTTVLLELLKFVPADKTAIFLAFNNSIVDELKDRVEQRRGIEVMTIHSYGWRSILSHYGSKVKMNPNKCIAKTELMLKKHDEILAVKRGYFFYIIPKILDLMRCTLCKPNKEDIEKLSNYYDLNVGSDEINMAIEAFNILVKDKSQFDFMDMIYQPIVDNRIRLKKYDYVFCDESQDFSEAQQEMIKLSLNRKGRLITVGDRNQSIYGFAGADNNSYDKLSVLNGTSVSMPLSVSYRCAKNIVLEAQKIVPEIKYSEDAEDGIVKQGSLRNIQQGDWILCRNLKPLIQTYLWLMKNKVKSKIKGKDIGEGVLGLINKTGTKTLRGLIAMLDIERNRLLKKLKKRGIKHPSLHPKMELLNQRVDVIKCLIGEVNNVSQLKALIKGIFSDDIKGIMLSTIHKSKGLENDKIFFLCPELIPSKYCTQDWQYEQEQNLKYVCITRAKKELIYVNSNQFSIDMKSTL